jgi:hypothetical protein
LTNRSAVDAGGEDAGKEQPVISRISREPSPVTDLPVESSGDVNEHGDPRVAMSTSHW